MTASAASCTRELDITPEGAPTEASFWKSAADLEAGANAMYKHYSEDDFYGRGLFFLMNASDDMVTGRVRKEADDAKNFLKSYVGASGEAEGQWANRYTVIGRANAVLRNVDKVAVSQDVKNNYIGSALFIRSRMYFELAYNYGDDKMGVPIVEEGTISLEPIARAENVNKNYEIIIRDLTKAAELLPFLSQMPKSDYGKPHKVAAWALLAKTYLYMKDWKNAELWATKVMNEGQRALLPNYADVFKAENNFSSEYIYNVPSTPDFTAWGSILPGVMLENKGWGIYNGWGYFMPTKELYNEFESGDTRRETTILKPGDKFMFNGKEMTYSTANSPTKMQFNKYMDAYKYPLDGTHVSSNGDYPNTDLAIPIMRYAEIILINAEAKLMQGKNADAEINMIRKRVGLAPITGATMANLKHERRCEFAGEWTDRHHDLVRWGDAQANYAKPLHGWDDSVVWPGRTFDPAKHNVWAVPQREIVNSGGIIKQNAGWQ